MVFDNLEVKHKTFGIGVVISTQGRYMTVKFENIKKVFVYPDAFERFLTLADGSVSEDILNDINSSKRAKQDIIDKKNIENQKAMDRGIVIPGKEFDATEQEEDRFKQTEPEEI